MNLVVPLTGSEAISRAQTEGQTKLEGSNINKSLLALSKVISQIVQRQQLKGSREDTNSTMVGFKRRSRFTAIEQSE